MNTPNEINHDGCDFEMAISFLSDKLMNNMANQKCPDHKTNLYKTPHLFFHLIRGQCCRFIISNLF